MKRDGCGGGRDARLAFRRKTLTQRDTEGNEKGHKFSSGHKVATRPFVRLFDDGAGYTTR